MFYSDLITSSTPPFGELSAGEFNLPVLAPDLPSLDAPAIYPTDAGSMGRLRRMWRRANMADAQVEPLLIKCGNPGCDTTFPPSKGNRPKIYCGSACRKAMCIKRKPDTKPKTLICEATGVEFQLGEGERRRKYAVKETGVEQAKQRRRKRITEISMTLEHIVSDMYAGKPERQAAILDMMAHVVQFRNKADAAITSELTGLFTEAGIELGRSKLTSLLRAVLFDPSNMFPERMVTITAKTREASESRRIAAVKTAAHRINKSRFNGGDWSKPTMAEAFNSYTKRAYGMNAHDFARITSGGGTIPTSDEFNDFGAVAIADSIFNADWTLTVYGDKIAPGLRKKTSCWFGPGSQYAISKGFDAVVPVQKGGMTSGEFKKLKAEHYARYDHAILRGRRIRRESRLLK